MFLHFCEKAVFSKEEQTLADVLRKIVEKDQEICAENIFLECKNCQITAQYMGIINEIDEKKYNWRQ